MSADNERDPNEAIDPPDNAGGNKKNLDSNAEEENAAIDPPDNSGGN